MTTQSYTLCTLEADSSTEPSASGGVGRAERRGGRPEGEERGKIRAERQTGKGRKGRLL